MDFIAMHVGNVKFEECFDLKAKSIYDRGYYAALCALYYYYRTVKTVKCHSQTRFQVIHFQLQ